MLDFEEAQRRVLLLASEARELRSLRAHNSASERLPLEQSLGRVLAQPVYARGPLPRFTHSAMDGYALRAEDLEHTRRLPVSGESRAGLALTELLPGHAARIFTGAPLPSGADTVVMQEEVERQGDWACFPENLRAGAHIRYAGEELAVGAEALPAGTRLEARHLALLSALDQGELELRPRPQVAILCTGSELRAPGSEGRADSIPESVSLAISCQARALGAEVTVLPFVQDEPAALEAALAQGLAQADLLITVGGVSVGDHDLVRPTLGKLGVLAEFWKVAMKPGKPFLCARAEDKVVLGLPGNPGSALISFRLFCEPFIRTLLGEAVDAAERLWAPAANDFEQKPGRRSFVRAQYSGGRLQFLRDQSAGATSSLAWANALIDLRPDQARVQAGELLPFLWL